MLAGRRCVHHRRASACSCRRATIRGSSERARTSPFKLFHTTSTTLGSKPASSPCPPCTVQVLPLDVGPYAKRRQFSPLTRKSRTSGSVVDRKKAACDCDMAALGELVDADDGDVESEVGGKTDVNLYRLP